MYDIDPDKPNPPNMVWTNSEENPNQIRGVTVLGVIV